jgi:AraC-like DNA-binding protein
VHPTYARALCLLLRQQGIALDQAIAQAGLSVAGLASEDQPLPLDAVMRLAEVALRATGHPWLGLELGRRVQASAHGLVGYAALTSRDLRQLLATVARYGALRNGLVRFEWDTGPRGARLAVLECVDLGAVRVFVLEAVLAALLSLIEAATGQSPDDLVVELPFAAPAWRAEYARLTGARLFFGASTLALQFTPASLKLPCMTADARAFEAAQCACDHALVTAGVPASLQALVRARLEQTGPGPYPGLRVLAQALHLSSRTLMRRLKSEGSSYQALLDAVRKKRALSSLQQTGEPVEAIAAALGFTDTSNFSRTCRRWFGATPGQLRAGQVVRGSEPGPAAVDGERCDTSP